MSKRKTKDELREMTEMKKEDNLSKKLQNKLKRELKKEMELKEKELKKETKENERKEKKDAKDKEKEIKLQIRNKKKQDKLDAEQLKLEQKAAAKKLVEEEIAQRYKLIEERRLEKIEKENKFNIAVQAEQERVLNLTPDEQNKIREQDLLSTEERSVELHARIKLWTNIRLKKYLDALSEIELIAYAITEQHLESSFDFEKSNWFIQNKSIIDS